MLNWRRQWHPTLVFLPGKCHGGRSLVSCSPWGRWELDTTERLHFHFSLSCIGEGNGNPLQCSCLENPRVSGAWCTAIYGVAQSRTRMKQLSSSSSRYIWVTVFELGDAWRGGLGQGPWGSGCLRPTFFSVIFSKRDSWPRDTKQSSKPSSSLSSCVTLDKQIN